jgi:hypothetical protein
LSTLNDSTAAARVRPPFEAQARQGIWDRDGEEERKFSIAEFGSRSRVECDRAVRGRARRRHGARHAVVVGHGALRYRHAPHADLGLIAVGFLENFVNAAKWRPGQGLSSSRRARLIGASPGPAGTCLATAPRRAASRLRRLWARREAARSAGTGAAGRVAAPAAARNKGAARRRRRR